MMSRETLKATADTVRKAFENEDADRAIDLFEAIINLIPDEDTSPQPDASTQSKIHGGSIRSAGNGADKTPEKRLPKPHSVQDGKRPDADVEPDREGIPDTVQPSAQPVEQRGRDQAGRSSGEDAVLTEKQQLAYDVVKKHQGGITTTHLSDALGAKGAAYIRERLKSLQTKGLIVNVGKGRSSLWVAATKVTKCPPAGAPSERSFMEEFKS